MRRRAAFLALLVCCALAVSGCGLRQHRNDPPEPAPPTTTAVAGSSVHEITVGGTTRSYRLYIPEGLDGPAPLVVMMHGGYGSGAQAERSYGWDELADAKKVVVAFPDGLGRAWNAGGDCCGESVRTGVDDVGFIEKVVADIEASLPIDPDAVFATGMSNGAMMAYRLGCETTLFAAIGPVAGTIPAGYDCAPPGPLSVMAVHGTDDTRVLYDGGRSTVGSAEIDATSQAAVHALWATNAACGPDVATEQDPLTFTEASCPDGRSVLLVSVAGYGHEWPAPNGSGTPAGEPVYTGWDATAQLWAFFDAHRAP